MPELPEVQLMVEKLREKLPVGRPVSPSIWRENGKYLPGDEYRELVGAKLDSVKRLGKFVVFETDRGTLVSHNAMSGYWDYAERPWTFDYVEGKREPTDGDVRVTLATWDEKGAATTLRFHDSRLFGSLRFYAGKKPLEVPSLASLGPDALFDWTEYDLKHSLSKKKFRDSPVKRVLMDQREVAGIGNIYATEGLWRARVNPGKAAGSISGEEADRIYFSCHEAIENSVLFDVKYPNFLRVYRQDVCPRRFCGTKIERIVLDGRSTYYCPKCQA